MYKSLDICQIVFPCSGVCFSLFTDSNLLVYKLGIYYGEAFYKQERETFNNDVLKIKYVNSELSFFKTNQFVVEASSDNIDLIVSKILRYIRNNLRFKKDYISYHASCIKIDGKTIMLTGGTHSGKTTLTAYLSSKSNSEVLSEDITILNCAECNVVPFHRPLFLRTNSCKLLSTEYGMDFRNSEYITYSGSERLVVKNHPKPKEGEHRLSAILFLRLNENKLDITKIQGFNDLLENSYSNSDFFKNICSSISVSNKIPMFHLEYYDLRDTYEIIKAI